MKEFYLLLRIIFSPSQWSLKAQYNKSWDKIVRELMSEGASVTINNATATNVFSLSYDVYKLGDVYINLSDREYFGVSQQGNTFITTGLSVSRRTRLLLREYVNDNFYREYKKLYSKLHKALK